MSASTMTRTGLPALLALTASLTAHPGLHHNIEKLTEALAQEPDRADLWIERARYYRLVDRPENAIDDLDHARRLDPDNREIALDRGLVLSALGRDGEAEQELTQFLESGAGNAEAFAERARIRERSGQHAPALADYSSAIALKSDAQLYLDRGALLESMGRLDEAAAGYRDGLEHCGGAVAIREALIRVEIARKRYDAALSLIDDSLGRSPVRTHWHLRRAEVYAAAGRAAQARAERQQALAEANRVLQKRETAVHLFSRAQVHVAMGRTKDARRDLELALEKSPRFTEARNLLQQLEEQRSPRSEDSS